MWKNSYIFLYEIIEWFPSSTILFAKIKFPLRKPIEVDGTKKVTSRLNHKRILYPNKLELIFKKTEALFQKNRRFFVGPMLISKICNYYTPLIRE